MKGKIILPNNQNSNSSNNNQNPYPDTQLISPEEQYIDEIIDFYGMKLYYFKIDNENTIANIYGETDDKVFHPPIVMKMLIDWGDNGFEMKEFGPNKKFDIDVVGSFEEFKRRKIYPELGDIIIAKNLIFEINNINFSNVMPDKFNYGRVNFDMTLDEKLLLVQFKAHQTNININNLEQYLKINE